MAQATLFLPFVLNFGVFTSWYPSCTLLLGHVELSLTPAWLGLTRRNHPTSDCGKAPNWTKRTAKISKTHENSLLKSVENKLQIGRKKAGRGSVPQSTFFALIDMLANCETSASASVQNTRRLIKEHVCFIEQGSSPKECAQIWRRFATKRSGDGKNKALALNCWLHRFRAEELEG